MGGWSVGGPGKNPRGVPDPKATMQLSKSWGVPKRVDILTFSGVTGEQSLRENSTQVQQWRTQTTQKQEARHGRPPNVGLLPV